MKEITFEDMKLLAIQKVLNTLLKGSGGILCSTDTFDNKNISLYYAKTELVVNKNSNIEIVISIDAIDKQLCIPGFPNEFDRIFVLKPNTPEYDIMESYFNCITNIKKLNGNEPEDYLGINRLIDIIEIN